MTKHHLCIACMDAFCEQPGQLCCANCVAPFNTHAAKTTPPTEPKFKPLADLESQ
jgi:hypothetical protein